MLLCTLHSASCIHVLCVSNADVNAILIHFDIGVEDLLSDTGILYAFLHSLQWFANHHPLAESTAFVRLRTTFFCIGRPYGYVAGGHSLLLLLDRVYLWLFVDRTADATRYIILRIRIQFLGSFSAIALCRQSTDSFFSVFAQHQHDQPSNVARQTSVEWIRSAHCKWMHVVHNVKPRPMVTIASQRIKCWSTQKLLY